MRFSSSFPRIGIFQPNSLSGMPIICQISHFGKFKKLVSRYTGIRDSFYSIFLTIIRYLEAIQTCTLLLSSLFDEAERGDSFTTRATPEVLSETVWFNDFQPT